jgi:hypothetical protein
LTRLAPAAPPRRVRVPLALDAQPVSVSMRGQALMRLDRAAMPHLFLEVRETGRGSLLYRRFDGRYAGAQGI